MNSSRFTSLILASAMAAPLVDANEPTPVERFFVAEGLQATVWAEAPMFFNPANMDADVEGRIWVAEAVNYRSYRNMENVDRWHKTGDRIMVLEDSDGDGRADRSHVFVQDKDLVAPMGVSVLDNRIVVTCSPHIIVFTDVDRDTRFDPAVDRKEILLTGFGGFDHDHSLHTVKAGPDGDLYFTTGNAGPHIVTDRSGWTLRAGSSYRGGSPWNDTNEAGLVSDDGRMYVGGLAGRMNRDGTGLRIIGHNFRNPYELALDSFANVFQNDNDDTISCRTTWVMEYGSLGFSSADGRRTWRADMRPGQATPTAHWRQDDPGIIPAGDIYGPGSPTGVEYYENGALGPEYANSLLSSEAGRNTIWLYTPESNGAGIGLRRDTLFSTHNPDAPAERIEENDTRKWFRPSDVIVGADGAIYVSDFFDPFVGGHRMLETEGKGTIYRIARKGENPQPPSIDLSQVSGKIQALESPASSVRHGGYLGLTESPSREGVDALLEMSVDSNSRFAARAIYALAEIGGSGGEWGKKAWSGVTRSVESDNADLRIVAYRAVRKHDPNSLLVHAKGLSQDPSAAVRREVALSLRDVPLNKAKPILMNLVDRFDGKDRWYLEALGTASENREAAVWKALARKASSNSLEWSDAEASLAWRLHTDEAIEGLKKRALAKKLSPDKRRQAMDALAFNESRPAANAVFAAAVSGPEDLRSYASWWVKSRSGNLWEPYDLAAQLPEDPAAIAAQREAKRMNGFRNKLKGASELTEELKSMAAEMASSPHGGPILLHLAGRNELPEMFYPIISERIHRNSDMSVRALATRYFPKPNALGETLPAIGTIANLTGDKAKGRELFAGRAVCATCHLHGESGRDIGPNLTEIGGRYDRAALLDSIINPSAAIAFGYESVVVETKEGKTASGFVVGDGDPLILKDIAGQQHSISEANVESRQKMDQSIMPAADALGLSAQDLADLIAFLTE